MWPGWCIGWFDTVIVSCLVSCVHFKCIVQYSLCHDMDMTLYIGQQHPITVYRTVFWGCTLFWCWVSLGVPVTISLIELYFIMVFIMIVVTIIGIFIAIHYFLNYIWGFLYISSSGSANAQILGCFRPWTFSFKIGLYMLAWDSFMSYLHSLLGYSTGEFQALQLLCLIKPTHNIVYTNAKTNKYIQNSQTN